MTVRLPAAPPAVPQALHLSRLAQGAPGQWVALPGGGVRITALVGSQAGVPGPGWVVCLSGEAVVDLPLNNFVRLRATESYRVPPGEAWTALPVKAATVLLFIPD